MSNRHAKVWSVLQNHRGRDNAITAGQLASITSVNEREVRAEVATLRRKGYPIASATAKPYGYFIPLGANEALEQAFNDYLPSEHQTLDLFSGDGV